MTRTMLKSKIHRATVTANDIDYEGSVSVDTRLLKAADILPFEMVHILDINNGQRFTTYAIEGKEGEICLNGAAARLVSYGDRVIILSYQEVPEEELDGYLPKLVYVDRQNRITHTGSSIVAH
jgi:aspartate 1-decarboxylase